MKDFMMKLSARRAALVLTLAASVLSGCASLNSVALTRVPANRDKQIEARSSTWAILGLYFSNQFAEEAVRELEKQCPGGLVSGVYTKLEGRFYFLWTTRTVTAKGYCMPAPGGRT